jgi:hypothetical protein
MRRSNPLIKQSDRLVSVPHVMRDLRMTAYCAVGDNSETPLLAAESGAYHDLYEIEFLNSSAVALSVNLKHTTGGQIVRTFSLPATSSLQRKYEVPIPQEETATAWTVEFAGTDISNTEVLVHATFVKELELPE